MGFSDINVDGYRYADVKFTAIADTEENVGKSLNSLELRDFGLEGGEIHLALDPTNRPATDPGVWYAIKCTQEDANIEDDRIGTLHIKQFSPDDQEVKAVALPLEGLDESHLLDRIVGKCLHLHAESFGSGPHLKAKRAVRAKR